MTATTAAKILASDPNATLQGLIDFSSFMDAKSEDLFWKTVREINPTLCPDW
ncbi:hypothetical protein [Nonomuraea pusilla]|uniref:Uncharacterized protein n=1 Tax=Nonomuraea pusilla TaxID=46177 RepID=A0A1H8KAA2_9ACTN|nr:hypothetical protein [Nonomuraea pusilla]SEN89647.1 hypothetical protein SAMN05660976_08557 [Nonomuraea pusilla]